MSKNTAEINQHEQTDWLRSLDFYLQELDILKAMLNRSTATKTTNEAIVELAKFRDQFYIHWQNMLRLQQAVVNNLSMASEEANQSGSEEVVFPDSFDYQNLAGKFYAEEKAIAALRLSFNQYCEKQGVN